MHRKVLPVVLSLVAFLAVGPNLNAEQPTTAPADVKVQEKTVTPVVPQPTDDECVVKEGQPLPEHCVKKDDAVKPVQGEEVHQELALDSSHDLMQSNDNAPVIPQPAEDEVDVDTSVEAPADVVPAVPQPSEDVKVEAPVKTDDVVSPPTEETKAEEPAVPEPEHHDDAAVQPGAKEDNGPECTAPKDNDQEASLAMEESITIHKDSDVTPADHKVDVKVEEPAVPHPELPVCKEAGEENCIQPGEVNPQPQPKIEIKEEKLADATMTAPSETVTVPSEAHDSVESAPIAPAPAEHADVNVHPAEVPAAAPAPEPSVAPAPVAPAPAAAPAVEEHEVNGDVSGTKEVPGLFHDRLKKFTIQFPEKWEMRKGMAGMDVVGISPLDGPNDKFRENVNIASQFVDQPIDLKAFFDEGQKALSEQLPGFKLIGVGDLTVQGLPVKWIEFTQKSGNLEANVKQFYIIADGGKRAYIITGAAPPDSFDNFKPVMQKIVESFRFEQ